MASFSTALVGSDDESGDGADPSAALAYTNDDGDVVLTESDRADLALAKETMRAEAVANADVGFGHQTWDFLANGMQKLISGGLYVPRNDPRWDQIMSFGAHPLVRQRLFSFLEINQGLWLKQESKGEMSIDVGETEILIKRDGGPGGRQWRVRIASDVELPHWVPKFHGDFLSLERPVVLGTADNREIDARVTQLEQISTSIKVNRFAAFESGDGEVISVSTTCHFLGASVATHACVQAAIDEMSERGGALPPGRVDEYHRIYEAMIKETLDKDRGLATYTSFFARLQNLDEIYDNKILPPGQRQRGARE